MPISNHVFDEALDRRLAAINANWMAKART
jgi:hypothetical protein